VLTCQQLVGWLTDYLEGVLPDRAWFEVEDHLAGCRGCVIYVEQMQAVISALRRLGTEEIVR
jgi:anti-sigma factor RsiW